MSEPKLNKRERYKAQMTPFDFYKEFETLDFESLSEGERFYLQDYGIFNTEFLEDEFTLRIRIPGGRISTEDFKAIAEVVAEYDLTIILTARAGIQLHDIEADDILDIHKRINALGVTTWQSFGDNVRNIVTDPYDGVSVTSELEVYPLIEQMQNYIIENPRYVGMLPRRVSIGISGNRANVVSFFANDIYFALAQKNAEIGFNVYLGGKNSEVAQSADIFLKYDEVMDFYKAFLETFYKHGSRFSRSKTRLFYLIEDIGMDGLKGYLETEYGKTFKSAGALHLEKNKFSTFEKLNNDTFSYRYQTNFSRLKADEINKIADFAIESGAEVRFGIDQNIYLIGLEDKVVPFNVTMENSTVLTCAGNLCPYAVWSIKDDTEYLPLKMIEQHQIHVGFSGCAKGCGRHQHTDIGLIGLKTSKFGDTDGGCRVHLGAEHSNGASTGRMLFSMVPFVHLQKLLTLVIEIYEQSEYDDFESYASFELKHFSIEFLAMWYLFNLKHQTKLKLPEPVDRDFIGELELLKEHFEEIEMLTLVETHFRDTISSLSKSLWSVAGEDPNYKPPIERTNFR